MNLCHACTCQSDFTLQTRDAVILTPSTHLHMAPHVHYSDEQSETEEEEREK